MKKALKITGITLASLVGLVLVVAGIAVAVVTSSGRLTKMVKKYAPQFVNCEMQLGKADLTLFKTFPNIGVDIENVALINPMAGSPSDTLANINNLIVVVDAKKFLKEKEIVVRRCILEDAFVNLYTDSIGNSNLNVFNSKEDNDTTKTSFDYLVDIEEVKLKNSTVFYTDDRNGMVTQGRGLNLDLEGSMMNDTIDVELGLEASSLSLWMNDIDLAINDLGLNFDGTLEQKEVLDCLFELHTPDICLTLNETYLEHDTLNLGTYLNLDLNRKEARFDDLEIGLNQYEITVRGNAKKEENKDVDLYINLFTNDLIIEDVLTYLPEKLQKRLNSIEYAGKLRVEDAIVRGVYNDSLMPRILAQIETENATVNVPNLPYPITEINLDADLDLDLNSTDNSVTVNAMNAKFNRSDLNVSGVVDDLLGDIGLKIKVKGDVPMADIKGFLPKNMKLNGRTNLDLTTNFTVEQLMKSLKDYNLNRLKANGTLKIKDFAFDMDTIHAVAPLLNVALAMPASAKQKGKSGAYI
ncbi:MAG: AsmA family protein, partial [Bacteroidales bacterium]|nr:AsmA family protein [Bacteroidales bacterium]